MSPYFNDKLSLFLTEVSFETSEENQLSYFQNGYFFKIVWWSHQPHNKGICKWKDKIISEPFTNNNHGFSFVSFSTDQTLLQGCYGNGGKLFHLCFCVHENCSKIVKQAACLIDK